MDYDTYYSILDKDKKPLHKFEGVPCFSAIVNNRDGYITDNTKYIEYDFFNHDTALEVIDMYRYFLFLKNIPEFEELMPYDVYQMAQNKKILIDIDKHNGLRIFSLLTVIRAVREDVAIVNKVLEFDPEFTYSWTKLGILKACGAAYFHNSGHWLTDRVDVANVNYSPTKKVGWNSKVPMRDTGLIREVNDTWQTSGDGFTCRSPVNLMQINKVLDETKPKVKEKPVKKQNVELQLDF